MKLFMQKLMLDPDSITMADSDMAMKKFSISFREGSFAERDHLVRDFAACFTSLVIFGVYKRVVENKLDANIEYFMNYYGQWGLGFLYPSGIVVPYKMLICKPKSKRLAYIIAIAQNEGRLPLMRRKGKKKKIFMFAQEYGYRPEKFYQCYRIAQKGEAERHIINEIAFILHNIPKQY